MLRKTHTSQAIVLNNSILLSEDKKPPKGFEKFFKRKQGREQNESQGESKDKDEKEEKREKEQKKREEEHEKSDKEYERDTKDQGSLRGFFFDPNNNPKPEGWIGLLAGCSMAYYALNYKKPAKELVYMDFLNNYLLKN